jgi:hypothetical protein
MDFKPSAGIFVGGLAAAFGGTLLFLMGIQATDEGAGMMVLVGALVDLAGIIMLCIGAARALRIIDAIPYAFRNLDRMQAPHQQAPAPQPYPQQGFNQPPTQ